MESLPIFFSNENKKKNETTNLGNTQPRVKEFQKQKKKENVDQFNYYSLFLRETNNRV